MNESKLHRGEDMDSFIAVLNGINSEDPKKLVEGLHQFYTDVTQLSDEDELVAAFQTVATLMTSSKTPDDPFFEKALQAIKDQMQQEIFQYSPDSGRQEALADRFKRITGETFDVDQSARPSEH